MSGSRHSEVARMLAAFNDRDLPGWIAGSTDDVEVESRFSRVGGSTYHEEAGLVSWWKDLDEAWETISVQLEAVADVNPERSVVLMTIHAKGRESGLEVAEPVALRWHWRSGKLRHMEYMDREEAELIVKAAE